MPDLDEQFKPDSYEPDPTVLKCKVTRGAATQNATVSVETLVDGTDHDKVRFQPRASTVAADGAELPTRGDRGVVVIDEEGDCWLAVWYPT